MSKFMNIYNDNVLPFLSIANVVNLPFRKEDYNKYSLDFKRFLITLKYKDNEIVINFYTQTIAHIYDVFEYIWMSSFNVHNTNFIDYCKKFGYNSDSIKIRNKFKECRKIYKKFCNLIGTELFEQLMSVDSEL